MIQPVDYPMRYGGDNIWQWKYIQYPPQSVSREEYYKKMREVAEEDKWRLCWLTNDDRDIHCL